MGIVLARSFHNQIERTPLHAARQTRHAADAYAANLQGNLEALVQQLKTKLPLAGGRGTVCSGAAQKAGKIPPPGSSGEAPSATVQSFAPEHEAALHLSGIRVLLDAR